MVAVAEKIQVFGSVPSRPGAGGQSARWFADCGLS